MMPVHLRRNGGTVSSQSRIVWAVVLAVSWWHGWMED